MSMSSFMRTAALLAGIPQYGFEAMMRDHEKQKRKKKKTDRSKAKAGRRANVNRRKS